MTDQELSAYEREHHDDPDMTLAKATETHRLALHSIVGHLGAANQKEDRQAQEAARRRLHQKLFPSDSAVLESKRVDETGKRHDDGSFT